MCGPACPNIVQGYARGQPCRWTARLRLRCWPVPSRKAMSGLRPLSRSPAGQPLKRFVAAFSPSSPSDSNRLKRDLKPSRVSRAITSDNFDSWGSRQGAKELGFLVFAEWQRFDQEHIAFLHKLLRLALTGACSQKRFPLYLAPPLAPLQPCGSFGPRVGALHFFSFEFVIC